MAELKARETTTLSACKWSLFGLLFALLTDFEQVHCTFFQLSIPTTSEVAVEASRKFIVVS